MGGRSTQNAIMNHRQTTTDEEPLLTDDRSVQRRRGSLYSSLPIEWVRINDVTKEDTLSVDVFEDRLVLTLQVDDDG